MKNTMITLSLALVLTITASAQSLFLVGNDERITWDTDNYGDKMTCDSAENFNVGFSWDNNSEIIGGNDERVEQVIVIDDNGAEQAITIDSVAAATDDDWD